MSLKTENKKRNFASMFIFKNRVFLQKYFYRL